MAMITHAVRAETTQLPFINIFRGTNLTRTIIVCGVNFFMQGSGQIFGAYSGHRRGEDCRAPFHRPVNMGITDMYPLSAQVYGALFIRSLGTVNPFAMTVVIAAVNLATPVGAMILIDKVGRRYAHLLRSW